MQCVCVRVHVHVHVGAYVCCNSTNLQHIFFAGEWELLSSDGDVNDRQGWNGAAVNSVLYSEK